MNTQGNVVSSTQQNHSVYGCRLLYSTESQCMWLLSHLLNIITQKNMVCCLHYSTESHRKTWYAVSITQQNHAEKHGMLSPLLNRITQKNMVCCPHHSTESHRKTWYAVSITQQNHSVYGCCLHYSTESHRKTWYAVSITQQNHTEKHGMLSPLLNRITVYMECCLLYLIKGSRLPITQ